MNTKLQIRPFNNDTDRAQVISLWKSVLGYTSPHSAPGLSIDKKVAAKDGLFFVALLENQIIGTVMAGYDGHRGWIYSLAVQPTHRTQGVGRKLMHQAESALTRLGCLKINLQVVESNAGVVDFYKKLGYCVEPRISMGKVLAP